MQIKLIKKKKMIHGATNHVDRERKAIKIRLFTNSVKNKLNTFNSAK